MITIVDYGLGNPTSIVNMLTHIGLDSRISANPEDIKSASHLILPGVGAFDHGMQELHARGLIPHLNTAVKERKTPTLGICLGAQLLMDKSEEGKESGLGWISGHVIKLNLTDHPHLKIPHMGWNKIYPKRQSSLFQNMDDNEDSPRFYHVHSYHMKPTNPDDVLATTKHGTEIVSVIQNQNITGAQFHPEKSHVFGKKFFLNYFKENS